MDSYEVGSHMYTLVLDQSSTCTGWAVIDTRKPTARDGLIDSGFIKLKGADNFQKVKMLKKEIGVLIARFKFINTLVIEDVRAMHFKSKNASLSAGRVEYMIESFCDRVGLQFDRQHPGTIKEVVTGKGSAKKPVVQAFVSKIFGIADLQEDQADALAGAYTWFETHREKVRGWQ